MPNPDSPSPPPSRLPAPHQRHPHAAWLLGGLVLAAHLALLQAVPQWLQLTSTGVAARAGFASASPLTVWLMPPPPTAAGAAPLADAPVIQADSSGPVAEPVRAVAPPKRTAARNAPPARDGLRPAKTGALQASDAKVVTLAAAAAAVKPEHEPAPAASLTTTAQRAGERTEPAAERAASVDSPPQPPPSVQLRYVLQRGLLRGSGLLEWHNDGQRYRMHLEGELPLFGRIFSQVSEGGFDAAGLAPLRHTEQRLRRSERAVNFVRPTDGSPARITFSASTASLPLHPGAQDRLSWMAQIATRLAGVRSLGPGAHLEMDVASAGGDVQPWVFVLQQVEADGSWHWRRTSEQPHDTLAEVWTDPAQNHWPRRVRLVEAQAEPLELTLQQLSRPTP